MQFEERIERLEKVVYEQTGIDMPGTDLGREAKKGWCLAVGVLFRPKHFFHGATIEDVVHKAEVYYGLEPGDPEECRPDATLADVLETFVINNDQP